MINVVRVSRDEAVDGDVNDEDGEVVDAHQLTEEPKTFADETSTTEFENDADVEWESTTAIAHRHCRYNSFLASLWRLSLSCNDDSETKSSLAWMLNSANAPADLDLEHSNSDSCRSASPIPSLAVD